MLLAAIRIALIVLPGFAQAADLWLDETLYSHLSKKNIILRRKRDVRLSWIRTVGPTMQKIREHITIYQ